MTIIPPNHEGAGLNIGIVQARFSNEIGSAMLEVCTEKLVEMGVPDGNITVATVLGALVHWKCRWRYKIWRSRTVLMRWWPWAR